MQIHVEVNKCKHAIYLFVLLYHSLRCFLLLNVHYCTYPTFFQNSPTMLRKNKNHQIKSFLSIVLLQIVHRRRWNSSIKSLTLRAAFPRRVFCTSIYSLLTYVNSFSLFHVLEFQLGTGGSACIWNVCEETWTLASVYMLFKWLDNLLTPIGWELNRILPFSPFKWL